MNRQPRRAFLSSPWRVIASSFFLLSILTLLLWRPWDRPVFSAPPLRFYCAANVARPMERILRAYHDQCGVSIEATYDGSGKLLATIVVTEGQGDLFLAADSATMEKAKQGGWIAESIPVAILTPVLAIRPELQARLQAEGKPVKGVHDLMRGDLKVALANPELASIGLVVREGLTPSGLWKELEAALRDSAARVSTVGTVLEAAGAIQKNDRTIGIVWDAVADQFGLTKIALPEFQQRVDYMWIAVLAKSRQPAAALQFARYLTAADGGTKTLQAAGYHTVLGAKQ